MKCGTQEHSGNSITVTWPLQICYKLQMADGRHIKNPFGHNSAADLSERLCGEAILHRISAVGQILVFHKTYFLFS